MAMAMATNPSDESSAGNEGAHERSDRREEEIGFHSLPPSGAPSGRDEDHPPGLARSTTSHRGAWSNQGENGVDRSDRSSISSAGSWGSLDRMPDEASKNVDPARTGIESVPHSRDPARSPEWNPVRKRPCRARRAHSEVHGLHATRRPPVRRRRSDARAVAGGPEEYQTSFELKRSAIYRLQTYGTLEHLSAAERWRRQQGFWMRLAVRASDPDASHAELVKRSTFLVISTMTVGAGALWALMYVALKEWVAALMPIIYSVAMGLVLFTCICRDPNPRGYDTLVRCQMTLILMLPFAVHVALGGVEESGGVMLWSFLCPMGAAFFRNARESLRWFWLYLSVSGVLLAKEFWHNIGPARDNYEGGITAISVEGSGGPSSDTIQKLYFLMNIIGVKCVIFSAVFLFARELEKEYTKSEEVLLNILPSSIVRRVKRGEFPIVDHVHGATILFADLVGFTKASAELHPNFLVGLFLRDIFQAFDELVYEHGLEKIKTIGDAYMVAGGLNHGERPSRRSQSEAARYGDQTPHATNAMLLAADMFEALKRVNRKYNLKFDLRIGVHTGPVVAGVLGLKRVAYDVWGDAVNTASRMESNGVPGLIQLSSEMHRSVEGMTETFDFECRGKIDIKGKGVMTTFLARPR